MGNQKPTLRVISDIVTFVMTAEETGGAYSLFQTQTPPQGGTPPHIQHHEEESFFVLEGEYTVMRGGEVMTLRPGDSLVVPRGTPHNFTNTGSTMARMLIITSPGGDHEQFFIEAGVPADEAPTGPPDFGKVMAAAQRHGIEILPPPR